jgi:hypothetical protein
LECAGNDGALDRFFDKFHQKLRVNPKAALPVSAAAAERSSLFN